VYRGSTGGEVKRVRFGPEEASEGILQDVEELSLTLDTCTAKLPRLTDTELLQVET